MAREKENLKESYKTEQLNAQQELKSGIPKSVSTKLRMNMTTRSNFSFG